MGVHGSRFNENPGSPYQLQQFFTPVDFAWPGCQDAQQGTFCWGEVEGMIVQTYFVAMPIDNERSDGKPVLFRGPRRCALRSSSILTGHDET